MLSIEEIKRYNKQLILPELKIQGQEKLKTARVLVVGAGGLGCPVLQYLAAAGVGTLGIVDFDVVDVSNLHRQILFSIDDIEKPKAVLAKQKISIINPLIKTEVHQLKLEASNAAAIISNYDLVVDGSDNFETRYVISDACTLTNKPHVYGGVYKFEGQLSVFNFKTSKGNMQTYRWVFPQTNNSESMLNCELTGVIGTLPGMIGIMQANEAIKIITGIGVVCAGKILIYNALTNATTEIELGK